MTEKTEARYYLVQGDVLPDVFLKVVGARELLNTGEAKTVMEAVERMGISRSAFYKYKDAIRPFQDMVQGRIVTIQILLRNQPGALSSVLNLLADRGGNVLTINQAIPGGGAAAVTVGLETSGLSAGLEELLEMHSYSSMLMLLDSLPLNAAGLAVFAVYALVQAVSGRLGRKAPPPQSGGASQRQEGT